MVLFCFALDGSVEGIIVGPFPPELLGLEGAGAAALCCMKAGRYLPVKRNEAGKKEVSMVLPMIFNREEGQSLAEYALILALIAVVAIAALTLLGTSVSGILSQIAAGL